MEITVQHHSETTKAEATSKNVTLEMLNIYESNSTSVLLENRNNASFMQTDSSQYLEYQAGRVHYSANPVSLGTAIELFLSFLAEDKKWISAVDWKIDAKTTEKIQSLTDAEYEALLEDDDLDSDFVIDTEGIQHWADSFANTTPMSIAIWRESIEGCRRKLNSKAVIYRWEWRSLLEPAWKSLALFGERDADYQLPPHIKQQVDELTPIAEDLAVRMEASFWLRKLRELSIETISNVSTMRRMLRETIEINEFITTKQDAFPEVEENLRKVKERFAWYRAKKKADAAEVAEAVGETKKAEKLRAEAEVMLRQDWREVFDDETVAQREKAKIRNTNS